MKAMIFAAGLGTRLKPFTDSAPKALAVVAGKTLLEHNVRYLQRFGIYDVIVNVHHFAEMVFEVVDKNAGFGSRISFSDERAELLETGGGLAKAGWYFEGEVRFVVMNADVLTNLNLGEMIAYHDRNKESLGTLAVMQRASSRQFLFDHDMQLCGWIHNGTGQIRESRPVEGTVPYSFSGIQVLTPRVLSENPFTGKFSLVDLYLHLAQAHVLKGYDHSGDKFIDVGKPGSIEEAEQLFAMANNA